MNAAASRSFESAAELPDRDEPIRQPQETAAEKTRRLNVALSGETERVLRAVSERTSIPIAELRRAIEESPQVQAAATQALKFRYDEWWSRQKGAEDIFGAKEG